MSVLVFGEILWDVYPDEKYIGGAPLNFAAHFVRHGKRASMVSALGKDGPGKEALARLEKWGVGTEFISFPEGKETGKCIVTLDEKSIPSYNLLSDVAYDNIATDNIPKSDYEGLYFGTLALRSEYNFSSLKNLLTGNNFAEIFADVNIRPPFYSKESILLAFENATILKISDEELPTVLGEIGFEEMTDINEAAKAISKRFANIKIIIITLGKDGSFAWDCEKNEGYLCEAVPVEAVSAVGAGDSFSAAFLYKYFENESIADCLKYASGIAAYVVSKYDAVPEYNLRDFS